MGQALQNVCCFDVNKTSLSQQDSDSTDIFLNRLIQFYVNNATNLHHLTTHSATCWPTKWRSHCDHRYVTSLYPMYKLTMIESNAKYFSFRYAHHKMNWKLLRKTLNTWIFITQISTTVSAMSHLRFCRATLTRDSDARQSRIVRLHSRTMRLWRSV